MAGQDANEGGSCKPTRFAPSTRKSRALMPKLGHAARRHRMERRVTHQTACGHPGHGPRQAS